MTSDLRIEVEEFLAKTGISPSRLGRASVSDPKFYWELARGRIVRQVTAEKVRTFMREIANDHRPEKRMSLYEETSGLEKAEG